MPSLLPCLSPCSVREGPWALVPRVPAVTTGLPRIGTLPGTSNKPPGKRQETAYGHAQRGSPFSPRGIPLWGSQPRVGSRGPGGRLGGQAL